jgi:hypothetical protein
MIAESGFYVPEIDWRRTARRVLTRNGSTASSCPSAIS